MTRTRVRPSTQDEVVEFMDYMPENALTARSFRNRLSAPPKQLHITTLLVMAWSGILLALTGMAGFTLPDPIAAMQHGTETVRYTLQLPMILLIAGILGQRYGVPTLALFLIAGFAGLPVFAGGGGLGYLQSPTVGYWLGSLFVPGLIQPLLDRGYKHAGWFKGRSLWLLIAASAGVLVIHGAGLLGLIALIAKGTLGWHEALAWLTHASGPTMLYDLVFGCIALAAVRLLRLVLWFCLY